MGLAHTPWLQRLIGGSWLERAFLRGISGLQMFLLARHKDEASVRLLRQIRKQRGSLLTAYETYTVYSFARAYSGLPGAMAEVGVFQGSSARMICEAKGDKEFHLFDTFEGLPESSTADKSVHRVGQYLVTLESVQAFLEGFPNVHFHKGLFPDSAADVPDQKYAFVHLDVDLYESTLAGLKYFYPKMITGGVILSHDYSILAGVKQAFTEFLADKPEKPIELPSTQCLIVKL